MAVTSPYSTRFKVIAIVVLTVAISLFVVAFLTLSENKDQGLSADVTGQKPGTADGPNSQNQQPCCHPGRLANQRGQRGSRAQHDTRDPPNHPESPSTRIRRLVQGVPLHCVKVLTTIDFRASTVTVSRSGAIEVAE